MEVILWGPTWFTVVADLLVAPWGVVLLGIGFIIIQHIPEHTKQLERISTLLASIDGKLDQG